MAFNLEDARKDQSCGPDKTGTITEAASPTGGLEPVDTGLDWVLEGFAKSLCGPVRSPGFRSHRRGHQTADQGVGESPLQGVECKVLSAIISTRWPTTAGSRSVGNVRLNSKPASQFMRRQVGRSPPSLTGERVMAICVVVTPSNHPPPKRWPTEVARRDTGHADREQHRDRAHRWLSRRA